MLRVVTFGELAVTRSADEPGRPPARLAVQPRRLALLAVLARAGDRGATREALLSLLWESDDDRARRALSQALYGLRGDLGDDAAVVGTHALRLDPTRVSSDVGDFAAQMRLGRLEQAAALYRGPFLDGIRAAGTPEFERWVDEERRTLARDHARLLERLALAAERDGNAAAAVGWWRALAGVDPADARVAVRLMTALDAAGDSAAALDHARTYEAAVRRDLDMPPSPEVVALAERLRATTTEPLIVAPPPADAPSLALPSATPTRRPRRLALVALAAAAVLLVVAGIAAARGRGSTAERQTETHIVAVGRFVEFRDDGAPDDATVPPGTRAREIGDLIATSLARTTDARRAGTSPQVVSAARIQELLRQLASDSTPGTMVAAARQAGATELIDGTLYVRRGVYRLDLRRVDLASGVLRGASTVEARDLFALADSGTARLLDALGAGAPRGSVADVTTRDETAFRLYDAGLRAFYRGDGAGAHGLFGRALASDSAFAMAAFYHALTQPDRAAMADEMERAVRLAARASERERLLVRTRWADLMALPELRSVADSLVARYPSEVEGPHYAGAARVDAGEFVAARPYLARAVAMDSLALRAPPGARCIACAALGLLVQSYQAVDALPDAERAARDWVRRQPAAGAAWAALGDVLDTESRWDDAAAAYTDAVKRDSALAQVVWNRHWVRRGRPDEAERVARRYARTGDAESRTNTQWTLVTALRNAGRPAAALVEARRLRALRDSVAGGRATAGESFLYAVTLAEAGRARESAAVYDSAARGTLRPGEDARSLARLRPWALVNLGDALARAGDTAALPAIADSLEAAGAQRLWRRDQLLHHHVRGLLYAARGERARAIDEWRAAEFSASLGYTRSGLLAARALTASGRPAEAIALLRPALHGPLGRSNVAVTHTELHEALAEAWSASATARPDDATARDSAAAHWRWVAGAWRGGEAPFAARARAAAAQVAALVRAVTSYHRASSTPPAPRGPP